MNENKQEKEKDNSETVIEVVDLGLDWLPDSNTIDTVGEVISNVGDAAGSVISVVGDILGSIN